MADLFKDSAGVARLNIWSLHVAPIPEPETVVALSPLSLLGSGSGYGRRSRSRARLISPENPT